MSHLLPEDQFEWNQYRFLPRKMVYMCVCTSWLNIAGWFAFDDQDGYCLDAPQAIPAGCQASDCGFFGVANVDREWEERERLERELKTFMQEV